MTLEGSTDVNVPALWPGTDRSTTTVRALLGRLGRASLTLAVALGLVVAARPAPLATGPRPAIAPSVDGVADRTAAPLPRVDERFATLPFVDHLGRPGTWVLSSVAKPLEMRVEQQVAERFGAEAVNEALTVWNDTPGSTFAVTATGTVDDRLDRKARDGVNRVFLDRRECGDRFLARAHLYPGQIEVRGGRSVAWVSEVDIGICERLPAELLAPVLRHELAHIAGVGHLCDRDDDCWSPAMGADNRCRLMNPAAYPCQVPTLDDEAALAYLHPVLPRVAGTDRIGTVAAVSYLTFPDARSQPRVLVTADGASAALQAAATVLAGIEGIPHLVADDDCTTGPDGAELNRVASVDATIVLVGPLPARCEDNLRVGWKLEVERLGDLRAVTDAIVDAAGGSPTRLVLAATPDEDDAVVADVALAAPAAATLGAPLLTTGPEGVDRLVDDVLAAFPSITGVIVLGSDDAVPDDVTAELQAAHDVRVRRLSANDRVELGLKISRMRDVFGPDPIATVLLAADRPADATAAATLATSTGAAIMPVFTGAGSPDVRVADFLAERVADGYVIGGPDAVDDDLHIRLNRAVDGAR